jgi:phosphatidylinositol alpha-mannosyltransferase
MKVGIVCPYSPFRPGGVQAQVAGQVIELTKRGYSVRIITPRPQGYTDPPPPGMIFIGQSRRIHTPQHTTAEISMVSNPEVVDQVLSTEQFDLLHIHEPLIPILALQLLNKIECPTIGTFHAALPDTFLAQAVAGSIGPYKRSIFKRLNLVTAVSQAATSYIADDIDPATTHFIPNGIDLNSYAMKEHVTRDPTSILYVGRLEKRKGVRYLLAAFAELQRSMPDATLIIAGDGPERNMLTSRARQLKLNGVSFLGQVDEAQKRQLLASCGLFTSPALYGESFGVVLLEAMAAGAVTVAGDNSGYASVLIGTGRLSLVGPKSGVEYARRMELLMTDLTLQKAWRGWAAAQVKRFDYRSVVDEFEKLYHQLVQAPR